MSNERNDYIRECAIEWAENIHYLYGDLLQTPQYSSSCSDQDCCDGQDLEEADKIEKKLIKLFKAHAG